MRHGLLKTNQNQHVLEFSIKTLLKHNTYHLTVNAWLGGIEVLHEIGNIKQHCLPRSLPGKGETNFGGWSNIGHVTLILYVIYSITLILIHSLRNELGISWNMISSLVMVGLYLSVLYFSQFLLSTSYTQSANFFVLIWKLFSQSNIYKSAKRLFPDSNFVQHLNGISNCSFSNINFSWKVFENLPLDYIDCFYKGQNNKTFMNFYFKRMLMLSVNKMWILISIYLLGDE